MSSSVAIYQKSKSEICLGQTELQENAIYYEMSVYIIAKKKQ